MLLRVVFHGIVENIGGIEVQRGDTNVRAQFVAPECQRVLVQARAIQQVDVFLGRDANGSNEIGEIVAESAAGRKQFFILLERIALADLNRCACVAASKDVSAAEDIVLDPVVDPRTRLNAIETGESPKTEQVAFVELESFTVFVGDLFRISVVRCGDELDFGLDLLAKRFTLA